MGGEYSRLDFDREGRGLVAQRGEAGARLLAVLARVQRARRHLAGQARLPRTRPALHRGGGGLGRVLGQLGLGGRGGQQGHAHSAHAGAPRRGGDFPATSGQIVALQQ